VAASGPNKVCSIIGPSLKQQKKIVWNNHRLQNFAPKSWGGVPYKSECRVEFPNGSFIEVDGSENSEAHRGEEQDLLVLDELKDHEYDSYNAMYPNLAPRDGVLVVIGSPPRTKDNIYWDLEQKALKDPRWLVVHWRCWLNLDPKIQKWLREEREAHYLVGDGYIWESEYEANYVFGGKDAVFSVFDEDKHVKPYDVIDALMAKDRHKLDYFIVTDPGNRVCHATLFIAFDSTNNYVYVLDELYEKELSQTATSLIFPRIMEKARAVFPEGKVPWYIYDEAALWYVTEIGAQFPDSPPMCPTNKSLKDKETSMGTIKGCMVKQHYIQSERCEHLKEEVQMYYLDKKGEYVKKNDHAIDCLRYFFDFVDYSYQLSTEQEAKDRADGPTVRSDRRLVGFDDDLMDVTLDEGDMWN